MSSDKMDDSMSSEWEFIRDGSESFLDVDSDAFNALFEELGKDNPEATEATVIYPKKYPDLGCAQSMPKPALSMNAMYPQHQGKFFAPSHFLTPCCFGNAY